MNWKKRRNGKKWKEAAAAVLAAGLLAALAGCGKDAGDAADSAAGTASGEDFVYVADYQSLAQDGYNATEAVFDKEKGHMYYIGNGETDSRLYDLEIGKEQARQIPLTPDENSLFGGLGMDPEGNLLVGVTTYGKTVAEMKQAESAEAPTKVVLKKLKPDGTVLEEVDVTTTLAKQPDFYISSLTMDKAGCYFVCLSSSVYVFYPEGLLIGEFISDSYISAMFPIEGERVVVGGYSDTGWKLQEVDLAGKTLKDLAHKIPFDYGSYKEGTDTDLLYTQGTVLYSCNLEDEKPVQILDWVDSDIDSNSLNNFCMLKDGRIAAFSVTYTEDSAQGELAVLTKTPKDQVPQKTVLTYASMYVPYFASQDIVAFNKQSDKYRIEVKNYGDETTEMADKLSLINTDIAAGKGPDIIDLNYGPFEDYVSSGVLEDLTPYFEKDPELKREDFLPNILSQYEMDGRLYAIIPNFGIRTIAGKVSDVGEEAFWTVQDIIKLAQTKDEGTELLSYATRNSILSSLCMFNQDAFVNRETGECDFAGEEFKEILEFAGLFPKELNIGANDPSPTEKLAGGDLLLMDTILTSVQQYQMYEVMFGGPVNFIGYPVVLSTDSSGQPSGNMVSANGTTVGMNAGSEHKDGVWEFIRFNLTKDRQENIESANAGFPILKSALEKQFEEDMTSEYYEDVDGTQKEKSKGVWGTENVTVDIYAATGEQVDRVREMIDSVPGGVRSDDKMFAIISEEAQAFFEGQKSVEDVTALIQNRVQTYVNEKR